MSQLTLILSANYKTSQNRNVRNVSTLANTQPPHADLKTNSSTTNDNHVTNTPVPTIEIIPTRDRRYVLLRFERRTNVKHTNHNRNHAIQLRNQNQKSRKHMKICEPSKEQKHNTKLKRIKSYLISDQELAG